MKSIDRNGQEVRATNLTIDVSTIDPETVGYIVQEVKKLVASTTHTHITGLRISSCKMTRAAFAYADVVTHTVNQPVELEDVNDDSQSD